MKFLFNLSDGDLILRPPELIDLEETVQAVFESISDIKPWMEWAHDGYTEHEALEYILYSQQGWEQDTFYNFTIYSLQENTFLGSCNLNHIDRSFRLCNLAYWVRSSRRGQGIAARAARLAARFAFEQLELLRVELVVAEGNQASLRVAQKTGAKREGVLRNRLVIRDVVQDAVMHSLIPQDFHLQPI
jgi:ribosomal-protein-serine acetyltransferase